MECEFIGGSRDGGTIEIPTPLFGPGSVFNGPVFFRPIVPNQTITPATESIALTQEVYEMTEAGKLHFIGYSE